MNACLHVATPNSSLKKKTADESTEEKHHRHHNHHPTILLFIHRIEQTSHRQNAVRGRSRCFKGLPCRWDCLLACLGLTHVICAAPCAARGDLGNRIRRGCGRTTSQGSSIGITNHHHTGAAIAHLVSAPSCTSSRLPRCPDPTPRHVLDRAWVRAPAPHTTARCTRLIIHARISVIVIGAPLPYLAFYATNFLEIHAVWLSIFLDDINALPRPEAVIYTQGSTRGASCARDAAEQEAEREKERRRRLSLPLRSSSAIKPRALTFVPAIHHGSRCRCPAAKRPEQ